jgi:very-short-patch-repair endonuclease
MNPCMCNNSNMREEIKLAARELRKNQTKGEEILWKRLRNRGFLGKKFNRQFPLIFNLNKLQRFFIADFCCQEHKLIIEIDGKIHLNQYDQYRDLIIFELGYRVIRVSDEMIKEDLETFLVDTLQPALK